MTHTTKNTSSITSHRTTSSSPNTVALATTLTNEKAERTKAGAKQTISYCQKTREQTDIDCLDKTACTRTSKSIDPKIAPQLLWMLELLTTS